MKRIGAKLVFAFLLGLFFVGAGSAQVNQADRPLKILKKPQPKFGHCSSSSGVARVRATFDKSETVSEVVVVISSGCSSFDEGAVRAAKRLKFHAAVKDGEMVTTVKQFEYSFYR